VADLRSAVQANPDVNLIVTADERSFHGSVVHVIDLAKVEGITKFAINVDRTK
jgi:biopolymer transport protein ExbD